MGGVIFKKAAEESKAPFSKVKNLLIILRKREVEAIKAFDEITY